MKSAGISAKCCYSPIGPKSDSLCWCSNSKLGHFHALEFLPKWWKVQSIPRGYWLFNTWEQGTSYNLKILHPSSTGVTEQGKAGSVSAQRNRLLNLIKFCTWKSCYPTPPALGERGCREGGALLCFAFLHSLALSATSWPGCSLGKVWVALDGKEKTQNWADLQQLHVSGCVMFSMIFV